MDFVKALDVAQGVFDQYKADQRKWWNRMDGTPILNDVAVRMAKAFAALTASQEQQAEIERIRTEGFRHLANYESAANERDRLKAALEGVYDEIKHGDEEHRAWLKSKMDVIIARQALSPVQGGE